MRASIDVSSLYTNIPHKEGILNTPYYLKNNPDAYKHPENPTPEVLTELMKAVLKKNVFEFNEKYYRQIQGMAIGTKMAPAHANLFMGKLEETLIKPRQASHPNMEAFYRRHIPHIDRI